MLCLSESGLMILGLLDDRFLALVCALVQFKACHTAVPIKTRGAFVLGGLGAALLAVCLDHLTEIGTHFNY